MGREQIVRKLRTGERVQEDSRVEVSFFEFVDDFVRVFFRDIVVLKLHECFCRFDHGSVATLAGLLSVTFFKMQLAFEHDAFGGRHCEFVLGDDLAGALALADVTKTVLPRVGPVGKEVRIGFVIRRVLSQVIEDLSNFRFTDAADELGKTFVGLTFTQIEVGNEVQGIRDALRRYGNNGQTVRAGVLFPLATENDLKVRNLESLQRAADSIEADIGHVVLAATVEAAADLNVHVLNRLIQLYTFGNQTISKFRSEAAR